IQPIW
ncbi:glutamine amidotransferase of anthranilate synthase/aminodeoxychorismate synthase family protein, partial [Vibrio parahaemolyticus V-223/04]